MTATEARNRLEPLLGTELGTGEWSLLSRDRIRMFADAVGRSDEEIPSMMLLSLIPGLTSTIQLPIDPPRTAVNYGLDGCRAGKPARAGERVRARTTLLAIEEGATWLQIKRRVILENETGEPVLEAETLTRLYW
ncbi:MAG TPA: MaoC family dehydratase [Acidimicrobiia bacterium]|nr:MaoC family dehydratase [Acidimicrobiia bacterium]